MRGNRTGNYTNNKVVTYGKGNKRVRGTRSKNKLSDMESYSQNKWDQKVDKWIKQNSD